MKGLLFNVVEAVVGVEHLSCVHQGDAVCRLRLVTTAWVAS